LVTGQAISQLLRRLVPLQSVHVEIIPMFAHIWLVCRPMACLGAPRHAPGGYSSSGGSQTRPRISKFSSLAVCDTLALRCLLIGGCGQGRICYGWLKLPLGAVLSPTTRQNRNWDTFKEYVVECENDLEKKTRTPKS